MKRVRNCGLVLSAIAVAVFVIGGCGGSVSKGDVPDWFLNPPKEKDKFTGTGASGKTTEVEFAKQVADRNAMIDIASQIEISVQSMVRQFMQQSGTMEETRALQFAESVSKTVVNVTLNGLEPIRRDFKGGRGFSMFQLSRDSIKKALSTAARNAAAEYTELKAKSALDELDKAIEKME